MTYKKEKNAVPLEKETEKIKVNAVPVLFCLPLFSSHPFGPCVCYHVVRSVEAVAVAVAAAAAGAAGIEAEEEADPVSGLHHHPLDLREGT